MEYIQTHIGTIVSLLLQSGLLGILWKMYGKYRADIEERNKKEVARDDAIRSLLRTEIISINHKSEEKGFIPIYNLENITDMYRSYLKILRMWKTGGAISVCKNKRLAGKRYVKIAGYSDIQRQYVANLCSAVSAFRNDIAIHRNLDIFHILAE